MASSRRGATGTFLALGAAVALLLFADRSALAQSPSPTPLNVRPTTSTSEPITNTVVPENNQAQPSQSKLSDDGGSGVTSGIVIGLAVAAAIIFAGIAYRIVRGRPRTE